MAESSENIIANIIATSLVLLNSMSVIATSLLIHSLILAMSSRSPAHRGPPAEVRKANLLRLAHELHTNVVDPNNNKQVDRVHENALVAVVQSLLSY